MRRPFPRSRPALVGAFGFALALMTATTIRGQAPSTDPTSLARYVPKDNLLFYLEFDGLDAHADAWQKTAAYKILNETTTGAMMEDLFVQLVGKIPNAKLTGPEALLLLKHIARSGFVFAVGKSPEKEKPDYIVLVLRDGFKNKDVRPILARGLAIQMAPNSKPQGIVRASHKIISGTNLMGGTLSYWVEDSKKEDLVVVTPFPASPDFILETLDGKRPNSVDHPIRADLAKPENGFTPIARMFLDGKPLSAAGIPPDLGFAGIKKIDYRWGFQDDALMAITRISAPGPRKGLLALLDGPTFSKGSLPPIPESATGFTVISLDLKGTIDKLITLVKPIKPDIEEQVTKAMDAVKTKTKLRLKEDILGHLGPKVAWYVLPAKAGASATPAAPGAIPSMVSMMMASAGLDQVPKLAIVLDIDDPKAFGKVLDELMAFANREIKAQMAPHPPAGEAGPARSARNRGAGGPGIEFRLMPGETKSYVMTVPPESAGFLPPTLRPAIRVGPKHVVIAVSPEVARMALEVKGAWNPPSALSAAVGGLPSKMRVFNVFDPRETLPSVLAALPAKIQVGINTAILQAQPPGIPPAGGPGGPGPSPAPNPGPTFTPQGGLAGGPSQPPGAGGPGGPNPNKTTGGAPTIVLQVDAAKLPSADAIKSLLFPSLLAVEVNEEEVRIITRAAFPYLPDPAKSSSLGGMLKSNMGKGGKPFGGMPPGGVPPGATPFSPPSPSESAPGTGASPGPNRKKKVPTPG